MLNLLNRQKVELAGLDIGNFAVKLVQLDKTENGYVLVNAACQQITPCPDNEQQQREYTVEAIKSCLKKVNLKGKNVVCGISGPEVVVRGFSFPPIPDRAIEQAIRMEAQQVCPLDMKQSVLDFQLIETAHTASAGDSTNAVARQGVMTVGTEKAIHERTELLNKAGVHPVMVDVNALALLNCLNELSLANAQETVAVIDIGHTLTHVIIYGLDGLPFVRNINSAGTTILQDISRQTDLSENQVRQLFTQDRPSNDLDGSVLLALNNAVRPLLNAINETFRFYSFQEKKSGVDRILLCGGFALIDVFVEFLSDAVAMPVDLLNPFSNILYDSEADGNQPSEKDGPAFAVATGLAMRTL